MKHILLGLFLTASLQAQEHLVPLTVLHWNDFHARNVPYTVTIRDTVARRDSSYRVGGTAALLGYINKFRTTSDRVLVVNAGDDFQGTPISALTMGRSQIDLMNVIQPDAMVLGNHEFDYGSRMLSSHLGHATFTVISANLWDTNRNVGYVPPVSVRAYSGLKVGIIGLSPPDLDVLVVRDSIRNIRILPVDSVVTLHLEKFKTDAVDLILVLSHMGSANDESLARRFPAIDVIVGGHDHRPIRTPLRVGRTLIVQAGSYGRYLGKLDLVVDTRGDSVYSYAGRLVETRVDGIAPDSLANHLVGEMENRTGAEMRVVIGELLTPWIVTGYGKRSESNIGNWQADAIRAYTKSDISFQNAGGIRDNLKAGPITVGDIWRIAPFGNTFVKFPVSGAVLREMVENNLAARLDERGHFGGLRIVFDSRKPSGKKILSISIGNAPLEAERTYTFSTNNYVFSNLKAHFGMTPDRFTVSGYPDLDRDVFISAIKREQQIRSVLDGRMNDAANEK